MRQIPFISIALALGGCQMVNPTSGPLAPPFEATTAAGQTYSMLSLTESKPLLVVFIHPEGKVGRHALQVGANIQQQLGMDKITVIGIVASAAEGFSEWTATNAPPIPTMPDPDVRIIQKYKSQISPTFQVIEKGGIWGPKIEGCDATSLSELEAALKLLHGSLKDQANPKAKDSANLWP